MIDCQSVLAININSPIEKLLVLINQSFRNCLIDAKRISNTLFINFLGKLKKEMGICKNMSYEIKCRKLLSKIMIRSSFIFKENHAFTEEEDNPSDKVSIVEQNLDGIDIDGIGNLVDLPSMKNVGILI